MDGLAAMIFPAKKIEKNNNIILETYGDQKLQDAYSKMAYGVIHKPHGHGRGRRISQKSILLHKLYLVK